MTSSGASIPRHLARRSLSLALTICALLAVPTAATPLPGPRDERHRVQVVIDEFRARLSLAPNVSAFIVADNPLLVSVQPPVDGNGPYGVAFESRFLDQLTDADLRAVVAHELGHVWIFTHHPYLQTEALANQIAERLVPRVSLERVYAKTWAQGVPKGTIARFSSEPERESSRRANDADQK